MTNTTDCQAGLSHHNGTNCACGYVTMDAAPMLTYNYSITLADSTHEFGTYVDKKNRTLREIAVDIYKAYAMLKAIEPGAEVVLDSDQDDTFEIWIGGREVATIVITA